ncbi:DUF2207 domain-containing protein [Streptococcus chenjunshii]|uniref:DUF2207 domain-containing protein n=1 Tax=Streptococcus chenjunshii TaxID=2173853 RepID=A0A372KMV5_9STRE|nr:DUF2207 domain-containing protein [Streptococcus chenjunshii]AXQ79364.1 DUF2207 domain-containing protein [Streptococcus chenjunshii]RFU50580.1 DUF2207 domain-containing protein [Streptococcus chenjunshii]RFU52908.1 DUF2207 domain-containing protein [Streptococcus chenjunshii]
MKKFWLVFALLLVSLGFARAAAAADVDYSITSYTGDLVINEDNSADFTQTISYQFDSYYNGQVVTLGEAGNMPAGFSIDGDPSVEVYNNGVRADTYDITTTPLGDGYEVRVYNSGVSGSKVKLVIHWQLYNILYKYQDVAELNWVPISDWDVTLHNVEFRVRTAKEAADSQLWAHQGYFKPVPKVNAKDSGYTVSAGSVSSKFELHAYWDKDVINTAIEKNEAGKEQIIAQEKSISRTGSFLNVFFAYLLPSVCLLYLGYVFWNFRGLRKNLNRYQRSGRKARLYEVPEELSPLLLTQNIFGSSFSQLSPYAVETKNSSIRFVNLIQAVLLDLIDRKNLLLTKENQKFYLAVSDLTSLSEEELVLVDMAFGNETKLALDGLFSAYQYDHKATLKKLKKKFKGKKLETEVRKASSKVLNTIRRKSIEISDCTVEHLDKDGLASPYRSLMKDEEKQLTRYTILLILMAVASLGLFIYFIFKTSDLKLIYGALLVFSIVVFTYLVSSSRKYYNLGVLTEEGGERVYYWQSFRNMIRHINAFDRADIESVVVWNRLLVYATLFGYAKKVERYLKVHHIQSLGALSQVPSTDFYPALALSTNHFVQTSSSAVTSSHFSISSGSSGSFGGGGFSGGGGGGGGGAF